MTECVWTFSAPAEFNVQLDVEDESTSRGAEHCPDYLAIHEGSSKYNTEIDRLCRGDKPKASVVTSADVMTVRLHSKGGSGPGLKVKVSPVAMGKALQCPFTQVDFKYGKIELIRMRNLSRIISRNKCVRKNAEIL